MSGTDSQPSPLSRGALSAVFGGALILRLALIATTRGDPIFDIPMLDAEYAVEWANRIREGDLFGSPESTAYFRLPLYPWFLAAAFALPGSDLIAARVLQAFLGAAAAALLADVAGRRFGQVAGVTTGALAATSWPLLLFGRELLIVPLVVFLGALLLRVQDGAGERSGAGRWLAIGAVLGLGALARPNFLVLVPVALAHAFLRSRRAGSGQAPLLVLAGVLVLVAPVTVRNRVVSGEWIPLSYQGGLNLWIGNNPVADGMSARLPGFTSWRNDDVEAMLVRETGRRLGPSEQDAWFREQALAFFRERPADAMRLLARKTYLLLQGYEIRNNRDLYALRERDPILRLPGPDFGWLLPLAGTGFLFGRRRRAELVHVWGYALLMSASILLFFVCSRYRLPLWPPLLVYAGAAVGGFADRATPWRARAIAAITLVALVVLARVDFLGIRNPDRSQIHYQYGNAYARADRDDDAEREFRTAVQLSPRFAEARHHLGALLLRMGRVPEAVPELRQAAAELPISFRARRSLGDALEAAGLFDEAVMVRREAANLSANDPRDVLALADALGKSGRYAEAWALYGELRRARFEDPYLHLNGGQTALALGLREPGVEWLRRALSFPETRAKAYAQLGWWLVSEQRPEDALILLNEAIGRLPGDAELHRVRALARYRGGDVPGAIADLETVLRLDPADAASRRRLEELGRLPEGR